MNEWFWTAVSPYSQSRWWFGAPALAALVIAAALTGVAALRLHRRSSASISLTALALAVGVAMLLPGTLVTLAPLDALGLRGASPARLPTATFPAAARTLDQALQMAYIGSGALLLAFVGLTTLGARRFAHCAHCNRELHPSWHGTCPECSLMQPNLAPVLAALPTHGVPMTQFGGPAQTALLPDGFGESAWLEISSGPSGIGERFSIGTRLVIGRDPNQCQLVLDDPAVSSRHAVIERGTQVVTISDLGSRNGVKVNEQRIGSSDLRDGDTVIIGQTTLRLGLNDLALDSLNAPTMLLEPPQRTARLVALDGPLDGEQFAIKQLDVQIGRGRANQVVLDVPTVSRQHAAIRFDGIAYNLVDAGSPNGTWLDEQRVIGSIRLTSGAIVRLGKQRLRFEVQEDADGAV